MNREYDSCTDTELIPFIQDHPEMKVGLKSKNGLE